MCACADGAEDILLRLRRIEGQVRGLQRMVEARRNCEELLAQVIAVRAALDKVGLLALDRHIDECLTGSSEEAEERLRRTLRLILKLPS